MSVADDIRARLQAEFAPEALEIEDQSHRHVGHAGWREGGQTHFRVTMTAAAFDGLSRIGRERAVHRALGPLLDGPVHALALSLKGRNDP